MAVQALDDTDAKEQVAVGVGRWMWVAALLDAVSIVVFVSIGRSSHTEGVTVAGVASTGWPFLVGAAVGWLVARVWQRPTSLVPGALAVWLGAVVLGMGLRVVAGQGTALAFTLVATGFLGATFFGWRLIVAGARWLRRRDPAGSRGAPIPTVPGR